MTCWALSYCKQNSDTLRILWLKHRDRRCGETSLLRIPAPLSLNMAGFLLDLAADIWLEKKCTPLGLRTGILSGSDLVSAVRGVQRCIVWFHSLQKHGCQE